MGDNVNDNEVGISFAQAIEISLQHAQESLASNGFREITPGMLCICFNDLTRERLADVLDPQASQNPRFSVPKRFLDGLKK